MLRKERVNAELTSTVSTDAYQIIRRLPGIALGPGGEPMVSPEGLTVVNLPSVDSPQGMNVTVRGMLPIGVAMRTVTVTQGKIFEPGLRQIVVGESIARAPDTPACPNRKTGAAYRPRNVGSRRRLQCGRVRLQQRDLGRSESASRRLRAGGRQQLAAGPRFDRGRREPRQSEKTDPPTISGWDRR